MKSKFLLEAHDLEVSDAVDSLLSDVSIFGYVYGYVQPPGDPVSTHIWLGSSYSDAPGSSGWMKSSPAKAKVYKTRRQAEAKRPVSSRFKLFTVYGDPKVHGWAALSPFLSVDSIPNEVRLQYEKASRKMHS